MLNKIKENKGKIIANFISGLSLLILGAISAYFIGSEYLIGLGFVGGLLQSRSALLIEKKLGSRI